MPGPASHSHLDQPAPLPGGNGAKPRHSPVTGKCSHASSFPGQPLLRGPCLRCRAPVPTPHPGTDGVEAGGERLAEPSTLTSLQCFRHTATPPHVHPCRREENPCVPFPFLSFLLCKGVTGWLWARGRRHFRATATCQHESSPCPSPQHKNDSTPAATAPTKGSRALGTSPAHWKMAVTPRPEGNASLFETQTCQVGDNCGCPAVHYPPRGQEGGLQCLEGTAQAD